jgi:hypothetical protein
MKAVNIASGMQSDMAAKMFEADETGETFDRTFKKIAKHKPKPKN